MEIPNIIEWVKENAGREVDYVSFNVPRKGRVLGYVKGIYATKIAIEAGRPGMDPNLATKWMIQPAGDLKRPWVRWIIPGAINGFCEPKAKAGKKIEEWPHICPACKGPAYVGFLTTVDCREKCNAKKDY
jgi:hypothetical protein